MAQPGPPPNWPIDYPYVALQGYQDENVSMPAGTRGKVISGVNTGGWVWVTMPYLKPPSSGWVPRSYLRIGTTRKYGDIHIDVHLPALRSAQLAPSMQQQGLFRRALTAYFHELRANATELHFLPAWFREILEKDARLNSMINNIMGGMRPKVLQLLNTPNFTIEQLRGVLEPVASTDSRAGVYTRIYWNFKSSPPRKPSQYTGKSNNLGSRDHAHGTSENKETNSNHYRTMRNAKNYIMGPLCYLDSEQLRTVAEQVFTSLFETYCDAVMTFEERTGHVTNEAQKQDENFARYYSDKEASILLQKIAKASFTKSGWPGGRSRPSYGASDGCNWNSPITEWVKGERIIWTMSSFPEDNLIVYRRTPVQIRVGSGARQIFIMMELPGDASQGLSRGSFEPTIPFNIPNLPPGTWVYPVIEMTADGSPHHLSYTRLPTKGPYFDWDQANSWAMKIEISRDDAAWEHLYLSCRNPYEARTPNLNFPGAFSVYAQGIAVRRALKQLKLDQNSRPPWMYDYNIARIKELKLDFLQQILTAQDLLPPSTIVKASKMKTMWEMQLELQQIGLHAFGNPGHVDRPSSRVRQPPGACDSCYLHNLRGRNIRPDGFIQDLYPQGKLRTGCAKVTGGDPNARPVCVRCSQLARPCTWTRAIEDCPLDDPRVRALLPRPHTVDVESIPDPQVSVHDAPEQ